MRPPGKLWTSYKVRFFGLARLIDMHDGYAQTFKIDHLQLLLIQRNSERYLIEAKCPHREHPLDIATIEDGVIQCALHHYRFAINDGRLLQSTEEPCRALRTYEVVYEGNELGVMLEA